MCHGDLAHCFTVYCLNVELVSLILNVIPKNEDHTELRVNWDKMCHLIVFPGCKEGRISEKGLQIFSKFARGKRGYGRMVIYPIHLDITIYYSFNTCVYY